MHAKNGGGVFAHGLGVVFGSGSVGVFPLRISSRAGLAQYVRNAKPASNLDRLAS